MDLLRDGEFALAGMRHALFVDGHGQDSRAVFHRDGQYAVDALAAVFQVVAIDDSAPGIQRQRGLGHIRFGRVDDERRFHRHGQPLDQLLHLRQFVIAFGERHADIQHVRAALDLPDRDLRDAVIIVRQQQALDLAAALAVDALAYQGRSWILQHARGGHAAGGLRFVNCFALSWRAAFAPSRQKVGVGHAMHGVKKLPDMLWNRAAAAANHIDAPVRELAHHVGEGRWQHGINRLAIDIDGQARVRHYANGERRPFQQVLDWLPHVLGTCRAIHAQNINWQRTQRGQRAGDIRAEEHAPAHIQRDLRLQRDAPPHVREKPADAISRRLDLQDVLPGLQQQHIRAAFN